MRFLPLLLLSACVTWPGPYAYSVPDVLFADAQAATRTINEVAGCELVFLAEPDPYVLDILIVDECPGGPTIYGYAERNEALRAKREPRPILIAERALDSKARVELLIHEIGHTLGLQHREGEQYMNPKVEHLGDHFAPESADQLRALCAEMENP